MTLEQALTRAQEQLLRFSDAPKLDAQWLLLHVVGKEDASWLVAHREEVLSPADEKRYFELVAERATGKPMAYILGEWEFYGRKFFVTEDVLVPRPLTEELVDAALKKIDGRNLRVVDLGTGSGIIAITLALHTSSPTRITAIDVSEKALEIARRNAEKHKVLDKIDFIHADMFEWLEGNKNDVDFIVSNPPYVPTKEAQSLPDPLISLDGGVDGRDFEKKIRRFKIPAVLEVTGGEIVVLD